MSLLRLERPEEADRADSCRTPAFSRSSGARARVGDHTTEKRLREIAEREFEPRVFGDEQDRFGWWFGRKEPYPRPALRAADALRGR